MMDGMNNGWGMGYGFGWIIGLVVLVVIVWLVVKVVNQKKQQKILQLLIKKIKVVIMNMLNDPGGYGMGFPWHYIVGLIILVLVVWTIVKLVKRKKNPKQ